MTNIHVVIPARLKSTRLPGKMLVDIAGKPMIQRVYEQVSKTKFKSIIIATDSQEIKEVAEGFGAKVILTRDDHESGTDRIAEAVTSLEFDDDDIVVNVQGDEPLIESDLLSRLAKYHAESEFDMATVVKPFSGQDEEHADPNKVKAIYSPVRGQCLYFSRARLPFYRDNVEAQDWFLHIGIYSFKPEILKAFCKLELSYYENIEKLEQLRALENGYTIGAIKTDMTLMGVDVPDDIEKLEGVLRERENES